MYVFIYLLCCSEFISYVVIYVVLFASGFIRMYGLCVCLCMCRLWYVGMYVVCMCCAADVFFMDFYSSVVYIDLCMCLAMH